VSSNRRAVRFTANFERNLEEIRRFLDAADAKAAFGLVIEDLFDTVIPNLEAFPEIGRDFLARSPLSVEGQALREKAIRVAGKRWRLREYITDDYVILYAVGESALALIAIKHHLRLSFDLKGHWA